MNNKNKHVFKVNGRYSKRPLGNNFSVSNNTRETHLNNNDCVIGGSGSSKTGSIVYSQLKSLIDSSLVVVDTKGQLQKMFGSELACKGYSVLTVDFVNPHKSCGYNPLSYIRRDSDGSIREQDVVTLAQALVPEELDKHEMFWVTAARTVLEFLIGYAMCALPEEDHNMLTIARLFRAYTKEMGNVGFLEWMEKHPKSFATKRYEEMKSWKSADKTTASVYGFVSMAIAPFDTREMENIFGADQSIDLNAIGHEKTVLFLNVSDTDHSQDVLINILYTQLFQCLIADADAREGGQLEIPVRIIMDDFASGATIPNFDKIISVVRSRDIWLTLCLQSISQLDSLYTEAQALTIINNCDHLVYMGSNDIRTAEFIATRALRTPDTILCMPRDKQYLIEAGRRAELMDKIPPYSYVEKDKKAEIEPAV